MNWKSGPGRPPIYMTDAERAEARREQNRLHQKNRRVSKKSLYVYEVSADIHQTPDQCKSKIAHDIHDWAEVTPSLNGTSAFARSDWLSKRDKLGQDCAIFVPIRELLAELERKQQITRISKDANSLICPTIFGHPPRLPDYMTAMGITIESSVRAKEDAVCCRGFFLDIENGDMWPGDFATAFPDLEFLAYSSWSHTSDAPRYRIGIPSTQYIPPEIYVLILHAIVHRLEEAGWGDALADGKKHGVDIGKLHEAAMFYLPSKRPDCFLLHVHEGRKPLNLEEWVDLIPDDLVISPPPPIPPEIHCYEDSSVCRESSVRWAIDYWRRRGCAKGMGRTQLWLLAKRLAEAGCDETESRGILTEQTAFATNPQERRDEIEGLLRDPKVIAARCAA
jgi:hypothetical protein